jgi:hypothetical protein
VNDHVIVIALVNGNETLDVFEHRVFQGHLRAFSEPKNSNCSRCYEATCRRSGSLPDCPACSRGNTCR